MYAGMASPAPVVTAHESDSPYSPSDDYAATTTTAGSAYGQYYSTSTDDQAVSTPTHTTATNDYYQQQQQYSPAESEQSEEEEEDEFNPYLFIKYLPAYERVVPYPHHKICLPPKDPNDPPISTCTVHRSSLTYYPSTLLLPGTPLYCSTYNNK